MDAGENSEQVLRDYSDGLVGTREAIERAGLEDFADLLIALSERGLLLPRPADSPQRQSRLEQARALLDPYLRQGGG